MTLNWKRLLISVVRFALIVTPVYAIATTTNGDLYTFTMLALLSFLLLRAFGYDILEYCFTTEISVWVQLYIGTRIVECVEHTQESLIVWSLVALFSLGFTVLKINKFMRFYFDEFGPNTKQAEKVKTLSLKSAEQVQRDNIVPINIVNIVLLACVFVGFTGLRIWIVNDKYFEGDTDEQLNFFSELLGGILLGIITIRSTSLTLTNNVTKDYNSLFLILLLVELTHVWMDEFWSQVVTIAEFVVGVVLLAYIHKQMSRTPGPITNAMVVGFKELVFMGFTILKSQPISLILYVILSLVVASMLDDEQFKGRIVFPKPIRDIFCPVKYVVDEYVSEFFKIADKPNVIKVLVFILDQLKIVRHQLRYILLQALPWIINGCNGPYDRVIGTQDPISFVLVATPLLPALFICISFFVEIQRILRLASTWVVLGVVTFGTMLLFQITADIEITIWSFLKGTEYSRSYTEKGLYVILCQLGLVVICVWQTIDRMRINRQKEGSGITNKVVALTNKGLNAVDKTLNILTSGSFFIGASGFILFIYLWGLSKPISDISIRLSINKVLSDDQSYDWLVNSEIDKLQPEWPNVKDMILNLFGFFDAFLQPIGAFEKLLNDVDVCFDVGFGLGIYEVCLLGLLKDAFGSIGGLVKKGFSAAAEAAANLIWNGIKTIPFSPLGAIDGLFSNLKVFDPIVKFIEALSFDFLSIFDGLFGVPFEIPSLVKYGFIAVVVIVCILCVVILYFQPGAFISAVTSLLFVVGGMFFSTIGIYVLKAYMFMSAAGFELAIDYGELIVWYAVSIVLIVSGWIAFKINGDEQLNMMNDEKEYKQIRT